VRSRVDPNTAVVAGDGGLFPHLAYNPTADYYASKDPNPQLTSAPGVGTDIRLDMGSTVYLPYAGDLYIVGGDGGPPQDYQVTVVDPPELVRRCSRPPDYVWWTNRRSDRDWSLTWTQLNVEVPVNLLVPNAAFAVEVAGNAGGIVTPFYGGTAGAAQPVLAPGIPLVVHLNSATSVALLGIRYARFLLDL